MSPHIKVLCALAATSVALPISNGRAQPTGGVIKPTDEDAPLAQPISLEELEKLIGGRTTLKFDFKDATPDEVASEMSRQTGFQVVAQDFPNALRLNLQASGQPFWSAILDWNRTPVPAKAEEANDEERESPTDGLRPPSRKGEPGINFGSRRNQLDLRPNTSLPVGRTVDRWPCLLIAYNLTRQQGLSLHREASDAETFRDRLWIRLQSRIEPRLKLASVPMRYDIVEAVDDLGQDLRLPWHTKPTISGVSGGHDLAVSLLSRPGMGRKLARLRGVMRFVVITQSETLEITDLKTPFQRAIYRDGKIGTLSFNGLEVTPDGWKISFGSQRDGEDLERLNAKSSAAKSSFMEDVSILRDFNISFDLVDRNNNPVTLPYVGGKWNSAGMSLQTQDGQLIDRSVSPPPPDVRHWKFSESANWEYPEQGFFAPKAPIDGMPMPTRLVVDIPTERREVSVPFEFTDLPLPPS